MVNLVLIFEYWYLKNVAKKTKIYFGAPEFSTLGLTNTDSEKNEREIAP